MVVRENRGIFEKHQALEEEADDKQINKA